jgi:SAM-dependent methyltransferase
MAHQKSKNAFVINTENETIALGKWDDYYYEIMKKNLQIYPFIGNGTSVLCLGARRGGEVRAFIDLGCFAVGIDLLPTPENKYVMYGDFSNIQYKDGSVDVVFTNSLDHSGNISKVADEICRVLKVGGHFITSIVPDDSDNSKDRWACCWWDDWRDIGALFTEKGLEIENRITFKGVAVFGTQLCFLKNDK